MGKQFIFLVSFLVLAAPVRAQKDSLGAEQFVVRAKMFLKQGNLDSAVHYHSQALKFFREKDLLMPWLRSFTILAYTWAGDLKQPFRAVELVETGLRDQWREPVSHKEWEQLAMNYLAAGHVLRSNAGDFNGAKAYYEKANAVFMGPMEEKGDKVARYLYHNLANIYSRHGDYERAISLLKRSLEYNRRFPAARVIDHGDLAIALNDTERHAEALAIVRQGLATEGLSSELKISLYQNEASSLFELKQPEAALVSLENIPALVPKMVEEKGSLDEQYYLMQYHASKAEILAALKRYDQALENYQKAIEIGTEYWGTEKRREIAKVFIQIGNIRLEQERYEAALADFHHGLQCLPIRFKGDDSTQLPEAGSFISENAIIEGLEGKARCFSALANPVKALECYELIPFAEARLLSTHAYESSSLRALDESRPRLEQAIDIAWGLFAKTGDPQYAQRAFRLTEQARGILLLQTMTKAQADYKLDDSIRSRENALHAKKVWCEQQIAAERIKGTAGDSMRLEKLQSDLWKMVEEENRFRAQLKKDNPGYEKLLDGIRFRSASDVPALLRPRQAFINYFLTENAVYVFTIGHDGVLFWHKAELPVHFRDSTVQKFIEYLAGGEGKGDEAAMAADRWFKRTAADLYQLLMAPVLPAVNRNTDAVVIAPDDVLAFLPFELLLSEPSQATWPELPFLIKKYSVSYAYSATLLDRQQANMREHSAANRIPFAGFAPAYKNARDPQTGNLLYPISGMESMVQKVYALLGGKVFREDEANETEFGRTAPVCRVLLLAMHGFANENEPALSRLLFGHPSRTGTPDNVLYTNELQISYLPVDLVVLNACYTGFGKLHRGEGVYSLTRALTAAGVPATVMSIWQLSGFSSPVLIEAFFQNLKNGMPKDVALQQAKIELLRNPEYDAVVHPAFWGGLLATGDMSSLQF
ncbi:MAG: hypothetical protein EPGJADBJ_02380 [Saprospiraceae bacterium]|nr:hypothetical protein [Saprospiraceae bacterium]